MKFNSDVISDSAIFERVSRSILFGYGLHVPGDKEIPKGAEPNINVIVIGVTEDSAEQRVKNCFKGTVPDNVACFGADSDIDLTNKLLKKINFIGHVIFCPEVSYLRDYPFELFAQLMGLLMKHVDAFRKGREMHVLLPSSDILECLLGAMFEEWKSANQDKWFFYDENNRYSRVNRMAALKNEARNRGLGLDGEFDQVLGEGEMRIAPPYVLDAAKTFAAYSNPNEQFDRTQMHPIRLGEDFCKFESHIIRDMLSDLHTYPGISLDEAEKQEPRAICVHESVAWKMFTGSISPRLPYYCDDKDGSGCGGGKQRKKRTVYMEEISK
jgi:hypothetical protein